jgi:hypothetical protein
LKCRRAEFGTSADEDSLQKQHRKQASERRKRKRNKRRAKG